jgi:hypothetical protein
MAVSKDSDSPAVLLAWQFVPGLSAWISKTCVFLRVLDVHGNGNKKAECLHKENSVCTDQVEASSFRQNHAISGLSILDSFLTKRSTST